MVGPQLYGPEVLISKEDTVVLQAMHDMEWLAATTGRVVPSWVDDRSLWLFGPDNMVRGAVKRATAHRAYQARPPPTRPASRCRAAPALRRYASKFVRMLSARVVLSPDLLPRAAGGGAGHGHRQHPWQPMDAAGREAVRQEGVTDTFTLHLVATVWNETGLCSI